MNNLQDQAKCDILAKADSMAAAATNFSGYGYDVFIEARETLKRVIHEWVERISSAKETAA